jgi:hypothetical protein
MTQLLMRSGWRNMMAQPIRYTCPYDLLPCIEAALAANGYEVVAASRPGNDDGVLVVMRCGMAQVLLAPCCGSAMADIEVWGVAQAATVQFLESLPLNLAKQPSTDTFPNV